MNPWPWEHTRRFNAYTNYYRKEFGGRIQKLSVDAGFTCPNRDGTKGLGGCTFCNNDAFNPSYCQPEKPIAQQLNEGIEFHKNRYRRSLSYLAYFQSYSNTYLELKELKAIYQEALSVPGVVGLIIGTRPDCIDDEKLEYFKELSKKYYLTIEYGIESCYDKTLKMINRGHDFATTVNAIQNTSEKGIKTGGHMIIGFPGESREEMIAQAGILSKLPLHSLKFHQLQIFKNTVMEKQFKENPNDFKLFDFDEYIKFMVEFVELLNPQFLIERIAGESPPRFIGSEVIWDKRNDQILQSFENQLEIQDTWQGKKFKN